MLIRTFVLKVIKNGRKFLTDHEIMDRIAEQIELVNTQVSKKSKFGIHTNLRPTLPFTCSFKFTYFTIKRILLKEIKNHSKLQQNIKVCH